MAFEIYSMKKEKIIKKTKDEILWEDFVFKNNIKKKIRITVEMILVT